MASFKSHPFFYTSLLLIGAVTAGEAWLVFSQRSQAAKLTEEIAQKREALDAFARQQPFPARENVTLVEADRREAEKTRDGIRSLLRATGPTADKLAAAAVPATSTDTWYEINNYVEGVRSGAQDAKITLPAENRLGFSLYAREGPTDRDLIPLVFRQKQFAEYLMGVLISAGPREILSLQRERPLTPAEKQAEADAIAAGQPSPFASTGMSEGGDYFSIDPRTSARVAGFVETTPFRISFIGTTGSLRSVLNQLAKFELPVVVRSVEVESLAKAESGSRRQASAPVPRTISLNLEGGETGSETVEPAKPLVEQLDSRFIVTVEFISLVDKTPANSETPAASTP